MTSETHHDEGEQQTIALPAPTAWPMILSAGLTLLFAGLVTAWAVTVVGAVLCVIAAIGWIGQLGPKGEMAQELAPVTQRPAPVQPAAEPVELFRPGQPGYRMRLPEKMHPYSAGVKGGIVGGLLMPIPAVLYGFLYHNGPWFPINLLAGMVFLRFDDMSVQELEKFNLLALIVGTVIHAFMSVSIGLIYAVLGPTLPGDRPILWGGIIMPLLWSAACYGLMGVVNRPLAAHVSWPWFILSQYVFGIAAGIVIVRSEQVYVTPASERPPEAPPQP